MGLPGGLFFTTKNNLGRPLSFRTDFRTRTSRSRSSRLEQLSGEGIRSSNQSKLPDLFLAEHSHLNAHMSNACMFLDIRD
jgi:hypothetical protein